MPGDFDGDGDSDGFDFLEWQRGGSSNPLSPSDLAEWKANFGTTAPLLTLSTSATSSTAVPEPVTWISFLLGVAGITWRRRHALGSANTGAQVS
jgi:hypothetical protein